MKAVTSRTNLAHTMLFAGALVLTLTAGTPAVASDRPAVRAVAEENAIRIEIDRADDEQILLLFRSLEPLTSESDLDTASELARLASGERTFTDAAPKGLPWYYGVFSESELEYGEAQFIAGDNVTDEPARITLAEHPGVLDTADDSRRGRGRPLPRLNPYHSAITGEPLPPSALPHIRRSPIDRNTEAAIERLLDRAPTGNRHRPEVVILEHEESEERSANEQTLRQIVRATVESERWGDAVEYLNSLRALSLSPSEERQALFYLGQAHYFRGSYRRAVLYLLQANEDLYSESRPFIDAALNALAAE